MQLIADQQRRWDDERGATLIIITFILIALLVIAALVLDFGLARSDKQASKSAGDSAATAGIRGLQHADGVPRPFQGVCEAFEFLKVNDSGFADLSGELKPSDGSGTPAGVAAGDPCTPTPDQAATKCEPGNESTWAWFDGSASGGRIKVDIRSGYLLNDPDFPDEGATFDQGNSDQAGCDQLAVIIAHTREAGFGSVIGASDITTRTRSVGRVVIGQDADAAVAMVLLEQSDCGALRVSGQAGEVIVRGTAARPGMIHADSDGSGCKPNQNEWIIEGANDANQNPLVRALAAPLPPGGDEIHGILSTYAKFLNPAFARDASWTNERADNRTHVWMCDGDDGDAGVPVGTCETAPIGADQITRRPADQRFNEALVPLRTAANQIAAPGGISTYDHPPTQGDIDSNRYLRYQSLGAGHTCNSPTATITQAELPTGRLYVDCGNGLSISNNQHLIVTAPGVEIVFAGNVSISGGGLLRVDHPRRTYVVTGGIDNAGVLDLNRDGQNRDCLDADEKPFNRERTHELVLRNGALESSGSGGMWLCSTFVHLMGGDFSLDPTDTANYPAPFNNTQTGRINVSGSGTVQWTAPNTTDDLPGPNTYDFEDLAAWTEASRHQGPSHRIGGSGSMTLVGIFVLPNANPLRIEGSGAGEINADAQMWTRRMTRAGGGQFRMRADPNQAILVPFFEGFELVR